MINNSSSTEKRNTIGVVIPTYNAGSLWEKVVSAIKLQQNDFDKILIIDSGSSDKTSQIAKNANFELVSIKSTDFNHGGTRNLGIEIINCDIIIFLTQDAIPEKNAISTISQLFKDTDIAVAYGRQYFHDNATPIAKHSRIFNYKNNSYIYSLEDKDRHGIKTVFTSNSFSAYRRSYFNKVGKFPNITILSEDMFFTAKALLAGYKVAYTSEAVVKHSHNYSFIQEFRRSFDTGVFHKNESWIRDTFGQPEGEGLRFVLSELSYLRKSGNLLWCPIALLNDFFKISGYKFGLNYKKLPLSLIRNFSMNKKYWK